MRRTRAALAALALAASIAACGGDDDASGSSEDSDIPGVETIVVPPYEHTRADVDYDRSPPVGGDHGATAVPCEFFDDEVPDEPAVHTLEHGGVWLAYAPTLAEADKDVLRTIVDEHEDVFASPYPDLEPGVAVVVSSWGRQLSLDDVSDPRIEQFIEAFRRSDQAPEAEIGCG